MHVKFVDLGRQYEAIRDEVIDSFDRVSRGGNYILSDEVENFEREFAAYCGVSFAVGVGNGSDALYMCLRLLGIGAGDEVITAPNSFVATMWAITRTGASPVFCDVADNMNIDPALIEKVINLRTKAILPVHLTGRIADMEKIRAVADAHTLFVVEDAAQAVGARRHAHRAGSIGHCAGFSLHPLKNLHVHGDGGVLTTNDKALAEKAKLFRNHGLQNRNESAMEGINSRLDAIHAAIARIKLKRLDAWNARHRAIAAEYSRCLTGMVNTPLIGAEEEPVFHRYMIQCENRDELQSFLQDRGVETKVNYRVPLHLHAGARYLGYERGAFPLAEGLANTILSLPVYPELSDGEVDYVVEQTRAFFS